MPKIGTNDFLSFDQYHFASETFARLSSHLLFGFAGHSLGTKHTILQNFVARTIRMLRSVMTLWDMENSEDCWILFRCLVDRYLHLVSFAKDGSYEAFDDWSFMKQFEAQNRVRSDPGQQGALDSSLFTPTPDQKSRYQSLVKSPPKWRRPKAEEIAKERGLSFLYNFGYDYASTHVHPMANDGSEDFFTLTGLKPKPDFPSQISVLHNSLLVSCLILQEALNQSELGWRSIVYDFLDHIMRFLDTGSVEYQTTFTKIVGLGLAKNLCEAV
jgi:hypothetical protein